MELLLIALTVLAVVGLLVGLHYFPWKMLHGKPLHPIWNYILGVLALCVPISGLLVVWCEWRVLLVLWLCIGFGGGAVMACYALDSWLVHRVARNIAENEARILKKELSYDARQD